jgi:hypothetical protein
MAEHETPLLITGHVFLHAWQENETFAMYKTSIVP